MTNNLSDERQLEAVPEAEVVPTMGKGLEHVTINSGRLVIIDQFMLANDQLVSKLALCEQTADELRELVEKFGGCMLSLDKGLYEVYRDPVDTIIILARSKSEAGGVENAAASAAMDWSAITRSRTKMEAQHHVFIDTRCAVFLDASLLFNESVLQEYKALRLQGREKSARDLLRTNGAAVRYGFNRYGDELGVFIIEPGSQLALWPDIGD